MIARRKVLLCFCLNYDRAPYHTNGTYDPRCLLAQQFTNRIETLDVVADGFKHHCDRNAE
jgi:hypothetical protein